MLNVLLLSVLHGLLWGAIWGGLDGIMILKGFLLSPNPLTQMIRSIIAMLAGMLIVSYFLGAGGLIAMIVALLVSFPCRNYVLRHWQGL